MSNRNDYHYYFNSKTMTAEDWDKYLQQIKLIQKVEFNDYMNELATRVLRELENTKNETTFSYIEKQCTIAGNMVIDSVQKKENPDKLFQMVVGILSSTFCLGIAIGSDFDLDK